MQEWLGCTVERILALRPKRMLEVGCGVGLLLQHLAPACQSYRGTDISQSAIGELHHWVKLQPGMQHVELSEREAIDFGDPESGSVDTVVLNSVCQYFPDITYLRTVLEKAVELVSSGGHVFVGDIRHLGLLPVFHASVQVAQAPPQLTVGPLRNRVAREIEQDKELVIDPNFFHALQRHLPRIGFVEVLLKRGRSDNELTRYRYDVVLHVGEVATSEPEETLEWKSSGTLLADVASRLAQKKLSSLCVVNILNRRLSRDLTAARILKATDERNAAELRRLIYGSEVDGEDPEAFWALGDAHGYDTKISWGNSPEGRFNVVFVDRARLADVAVVAPNSSIRYASSLEWLL